jgi:hypothetical protein
MFKNSSTGLSNRLFSRNNESADDMYNFLKAAYYTSTLKEGFLE